MNLIYEEVIQEFQEIVVQFQEDEVNMDEFFVKVKWVVELINYCWEKLWAIEVEIGGLFEG